MEENRSRNGVIFPYVILAVVIVSTALILFQLWSSVSPLVVLPNEGPTPTHTLWWRTPKAETLTPTPSATLPILSMDALLTTPMPAVESSVEELDD